VIRRTQRGPHRPRRPPWTDVLVAASVALVATAACSTHAYCFDGCGEGGADADQGSAGSGTGGKPALVGSAGEGASPSLRDAGADSGDCKSEGEEVCDGRDNDCNGKIDDGIDFEEPQNCGTCSLDCSRVLLNVAEPICVPPAKLDGTHAGTCTFDQCAQDYYDLDPETPGCEYFCDRNPDGKIKKDLGGEGCGRDDDCDGEVDEDLDLCADVNNCGACGKTCQVAHGTAACVSDAEEGDACTEKNTQCAVQSCDDEYSDRDGDPENGCEYQCIPDGAEKCDGKDNDCDGLIDNTDPDLEKEAHIGDACWGGSQGACHSSEHQGIRKCIGAQLKCCDPGSNDVAGTNANAPKKGVRNGVCEADTGSHVLRPGERSETCNAVDDDCDGVADDSPKQVGNACGTAQGVCVAGTLTCESDPDSADYGKLICRGATEPREEVCNGKDDDCDGVVDGTVITPAVECGDDNDCTEVDGICLPLEQGDGSVCALPSADSGDACSVPKPPPKGATSACRAGLTECHGGMLLCEGAVTRLPSVPDTCGVDQNCDGALDNTNLTLLTTCGSCSKDCTRQGPNAAWTCESDGDGSYQCVQHGCNDGWYECKADDGIQCETYCQPTGSEVCNGVDDDCDCEVDEDVTADARSVCGVRSTANPGCNPGVECDDGQWECTFSDPDICGDADGCAGTTDDTCDDKDNDCDGVVDNAFAEQKGTTCVKTQGECEETGTRVCNALGELECNAPDPEIGTEICNGKDDDCDGNIDETIADKEADDDNYVVPDLVALGDSGPWIFAYEASRPDATDATQGSGNGYFDVAPSGEGRDATIACSAPDRMPWTNVSPWEAEQTCQAIGGRICRPSDWETACLGSPGTCSYGFLGCETASNYDDGPFCNLGAFHADDDALLPTASTELRDCAALWTGTNGNALDAFDITGNAREAVRCQRDRAVCADCALNCCSGASSTVAGPDGNRTVCGTGLGNTRVLSGQPCSSGGQCCDDDTTCSNNGTCQDDICVAADAADPCVARGVACTDADEDGYCDEYGTDNVPCCDDAPLSGGVCGGVTSLPHATYPLLGGSYQTDSEDSATCDYSFFKVDYGFRLYDTGFRCCFDVDPR
jgi:hypothetical protein